VRAGIDTSIETFTGLYLDYSDPKPDQISVLDIARALSFSCRWAGHCSRYYSVAEHAVRVRDAVIQAGYPQYAFAALHHDSHEAYVGDWPTPLKRTLENSGYRDLVNRIDYAISDAFGFCESEMVNAVVRAADELLLWREAACLKDSGGHGPHWGDHPVALWLAEPYGWPPPLAQSTFLQAHYDDMERYG
jgi:hypothetical protein